MTAVGITPPQVTDIDVQQLSSDLSEAVLQVKEIQVLVRSFIDTIVIRKNDEVEKETDLIKSTINQVRAITYKLDRLGSKYSKLRLNHIHVVPLGNTGYISLDPTEEQSGFYKQLLDCYSWLKKLDHDATYMLNCLKQSDVPSDDLLTKTLKPSVEVVTLHDLVAVTKLKFPLLLFDDRRLSFECCLEVKLPGVFCVNVFFSGLIISHAIVKSMMECFNIEAWEDSEHLVFKKMSDVFISIILSLTQKDSKMLLHEFLSYVSAYKDVFRTKCKNCNMILRSESGTTHLLPPIWKDINTNEFYHLSCKI